MVGAIANHIRKNAPEVEEVPIAPIIVFTTKNIEELDIRDSRIPALHYSKLKSYLRKQRGKLPPMPKSDFEALRAAFDKQAKHLLDE